MAGASEARYLLVKRGLYYRPDNHGYTGIKEHAGRYLESDASPDSEVTAIHEDDAPDYSPACFADLQTKHILEKLGAAERERDQLYEAMEGIVHFGDAVAYRSDPLSVALRQWIEAGSSLLSARLSTLSDPVS